MRSQASFFNTIQLSAPELQVAEQKAKTQEELIHETFKHINAPMTPFDVQRVLIMKEKKFPITSIRRAITVLADKGVLVKSGTHRTGDYGTKNNTWKIKN